MASIIRVKRSTGTEAPSILQFGELGLTVGVGSHGNRGGRIFAGDNAQNAQIVGGRYYTDLLSIEPGKVAGQDNPTTVANGFVPILLTENSGNPGGTGNIARLPRVDQWSVDNITIDGNTIYSNDTNGDIKFVTNGTGQVNIDDDTYLSFGQNKDVKIEYDEDDTDKLQISGADWNFVDGVQITISEITNSTSTSTGALVVSGGVGIAQSVHIGGDVDIGGDINIDGSATIGTIASPGDFTVTGDLTVQGGDIDLTYAATNLSIKDNTSSAFVVKEGSNNYINIGTNDNTEKLTLGNSIVSVDVVVEDNAANAFLLKEGSNTYLQLVTTDNSESLNLGNNIATVNIVVEDNKTSAFLLKEGTSEYIAVDTTNGSELITFSTANVDIDNDLNVDGGDITTNQTLFNLLNANATTVNAFGAATTLNLGATTGTATVKNSTLSVPNATTINLGRTDSTTTVTFSSTKNDSKVAIAATTQSTSKDTGALVVEGGVGIEKNLYVNGNANVTGNTTLTGTLIANGNVNLGNASTDITTVTGTLIHNGALVNSGGITVDNVGISSNVISTRSGAGNILYIDPYPDGLSNEGTVVIKGDLQVDGTTTTVNSSSVTVNEPILNLGDVTSIRTVTEAVQSGVSTVRVDSIVGINTGDTIQGSSSLPGGGTATVTSYNASDKIITFSGVTSAGIAITTQLTITHAFDTNTDRGISFNYNTSNGTGNNKTGFFGYNDSAAENSNAPERAWTYIPDVTVSNSVVSGVRGYLDIKGIYYQTGDFNTHGIVYFDVDGLQTSTNDPSSPTITSKQILTAVTEATLSVTAVNVTQGDIILQETTGAYGIVKTTSSGGTITLIGVEGTFNTSNNLLKNGTSMSRTPSNVSIVYQNKPMWTSTLDGGTF